MSHVLFLAYTTMLAFQEETLPILSYSNLLLGVGGFFERTRKCVNVLTENTTLNKTGKFTFCFIFKLSHLIKICLNVLPRVFLYFWSFKISIS